MIFKELDFVPILLGSDINTYSMARAFHEEYQVKSIVIGKYRTGPSYNSKIIDFRAEEKIDEEECFLKTLNDLVIEKKDKKLLLIGCGDSYVSLISKNKNILSENYITPYIDYEKMGKLIRKDQFYNQCEKYNLKYPKTFIYKKEMGSIYSLPFNFPVIVKPSNSIDYWKHPFSSQKKVYKANHREEFDKIINDIYGAGYNDSLIIQDFIPGDDSFMRVMTCYSDRNGKVQMMSLGHVLLEEHTPHGLGNHAVIINEYNEKLIDDIKIFLENIGYIGFSNFDIKYDTRDDQYKIFEINIRQGRSNFYVTGSGNNLAKYVVSDFIYHQQFLNTNKLGIVLDKKLWLVIPRMVAIWNVKSKETREEMKMLIKNAKVINPLFYKGDNNIKRLFYLWKSHLSHFYKYPKYYH